MVTVIPTLMWVYDRCCVTIGDGWLDVEMAYQVVDAETGRAIPNATVEFIDAFTPPNPTQADITALTTNADGMASRISHNAGCSWRTGALGLSEILSAGGGMSWVLRVSSAGYAPTDWFIPNKTEFDWRSEYLGNHKARATIPIPLHRQPISKPTD